MLNKFYILTLLTLILGQFTNLSKQSGLNIYIFDVFVLLFAFVGIIYFLTIEKSLKITFWHFLGIVFINWGFITLIFSLNRFDGTQFITGSFYVIRFLGYLLSSLVLYNMLLKKKIEPGFVIDLFILSGVILSFFGFLQLLVLPDFRVLDPSLGWDPHINRLASSFFDPNFAGAYLVIIFAVLLDKVYGHLKLKPFYLIAFIVMITSIFLTFSRSSWGMLSLIVLIYGIFKYKKLLILFLLIAFSAYFAIPRVQTRITGTTDPADSAAFRLISWSNSFEIIEDNWLLGVGYNTYRYAQEDYGFIGLSNIFSNAAAGADSSFLFVLATTGIIGLIIYMLFFFYPMIYAVFNRLDSKVFITSVTFGFLLESQFINSLFYPQIMFLWYSLIVSYLFYTQR